MIKKIDKLICTPFISFLNALAPTAINSLLFLPDMTNVPACVF
jgi:hypothetical protein